MATHAKPQRIESFQTHPNQYKHWRLEFDGGVANLIMDIKEENGMRPDDYVLKQNSYDMGVDMELADATERLRFEHPEVRAVVVTSAQPKVFCAGANIKMLASSEHGFKVNFCRFTNETRCGMEDATHNSGQVYIAALNGTAAGGGYELALACEKIYLIDDGASVVSLPEVPLLGVLPGTGGLTRLVDKRTVRRDIADVFCTKAEGWRARDALKFELIDGSFARSEWQTGIAKVAAEAVAANPARATEGITLHPIAVEIGENESRAYEHVKLNIDADGRVCTLIIKAPTSPAPANAAALMAEGCKTWSMATFRQLEDAIFHLRFNHPNVGLILLKTEGDAGLVLAHDKLIQDNQDDWFARELALYQSRVLRRCDNSARSQFALIDEGSCFVGSLFELSLTSDRTYMLEDEDEEVTIQISAASGGIFPMSTGITRLAARFPRNDDKVQAALEAGAVAGPDAFDLGVVTMAPDDIDWDDEIRIAVEERLSLSPDALTGMEQNLRFVGAENCDSKIFGRLTAWQNWIFQRPNAVGDDGALTLYGHPTRPKFDFRRT
ncbi:MAG: benzoyl-CoA-dihydrodiol lyase [Rhodobacterales bacterium]|nr:benzoyl-CoA-dihydrodiol lyase [Rhodobacterales bacterium]